MSDLKSKLPDLKELGEMSGKLFKDIKNSVSEIVKTYKEKHAETKPTEPAKEKKTTTKAKAAHKAEK